MRIACDFLLEPPLLCVLGSVLYLLTGLLVGWVNVRLPSPFGPRPGEKVIFTAGVILWWGVVSWWLLCAVAYPPILLLCGIERALCWLLRPRPKRDWLRDPQGAVRWTAPPANCRCELIPMQPGSRPFIGIDHTGQPLYRAPDGTHSYSPF